MNSTLTRMTTAITQKQTGTARPWMRISSGALDRDHDRVLPKGGDFSAAARGNLPVLWAHDYKQLPIGKVMRVWADGNDHINAEWVWLEHDAFADRVRNAWDQGHVTASSIGFLPTDSVRNKEGRRDHLQWELLEMSLCTVPSNREAIRELKALGLWKENRMDHEEVDLTPEQLAHLPSMIREAVDAEFKKVLAPRRDEIDLSDPQVRRIVADLPAIVDAAFRAALQHEVALGLRRAAGRLD